jgi:5-methyltetrahydrofolate--homocysteine methyltransferase
MDTNSLLERLRQAVLDGESTAVKELIEKAISQGENPREILDDGLINAMAKVGELFEKREYYVPEMLVSARAMQTGLALLKPHLGKGQAESRGKVVLGTVQGDLHDIGKNLVGIMLEGAGFEIIDIGTDASPERIVQSLVESGAQILGLSALLTTTMLQMTNVVDALKASGLRDSVKVMIGGAPVTQEYAIEIGADGYGEDAIQAVALATRFSGNTSYYARSRPTS